MSTPRTLVLPAGVTATTIDTSRGEFAAHLATPTATSPEDVRGHVLLIPGWTGSKEDFTPLLPLVAAAGYQVTAYDQRGQFETQGAPDADYSLEGYAADAIAIQSASGFTASHLLGHSFGGLVAQAAAVGQASAWRSLSLLCTGPAGLGDDDDESNPLTLLMQAIGSIPLATIHEYREKMTGIKRPPEIAKFLTRRFTSNGLASLKSMTRLLLDSPDRLDAVAALNLPFWVGRGKNDDAWPHDIQAQMAKRLGVEVVVIRDSAHSPAIENTEETAEALLKFWS